MMNKSNFSFLIDDMKWSYSRASSFETCKHGWKLNYIDREKSVQNYFAEYGLFHHKIMELFWNRDIDVWDMATYYEDNYSKNISLSPPSMLARWDFSRKNYDSGLKFYQNFDWNVSEWKVLGNEIVIETEYKGIKLTIRPDTLIKNKKTGKIILVDYKSSNPFQKKSGNPIKKKIEPYKKQLSLYCYFVEKEMGLRIDEYMLVFPKLTLAQNLIFEYNKEVGQKTVDWVTGVIDEIKQENDFEPTVDKFFCSNLCGVRSVCEHWDKK